jgi:hypothetical protein
LCGRGCAGARDQLIRLGEALKSPMVHALGGKEHVEWDNIAPLYCRFRSAMAKGAEPWMLR